jgi:hypothetical protein
MKPIFVMCKVLGHLDVKYRLRIMDYTICKNIVVVTYWYLVPGTRYARV